MTEKNGSSGGGPAGPVSAGGGGAVAAGERRRNRPAISRWQKRPRTRTLHELGRAPAILKMAAAAGRRQRRCRRSLPLLAQLPAGSGTADPANRFLTLGKAAKNRAESVGSASGPH